MSFLALEDNLLKKLENNRLFIQEKVNSFDLETIKKCKDKLLFLLGYEEYLMRTMFLKSIDPDFLSTKEAMDIYYNAIFNFLVNNNFDFTLLNNYFSVRINDDKFILDYKIKKKVKA